MHQNYTVKPKVAVFDAKNVPAGNLVVIVGGPYDGHLMLKRNNGRLQSITNSEFCFTADANVTVRSLLPGEEYVIRGI